MSVSLCHKDEQESTKKAPYLRRDCNENEKSKPKKEQFCREARFVILFDPGTTKELSNKNETNISAFDVFPKYKIYPTVSLVLTNPFSKH